MNIWSEDNQLLKIFEGTKTSYFLDLELMTVLIFFISDFCSKASLNEVLFQKSTVGCSSLKKTIISYPIVICTTTLQSITSSVTGTRLTTRAGRSARVSATDTSWPTFSPTSMWLKTVSWWNTPRSTRNQWKISSQLSV